MKRVKELNAPTPGLVEFLQHYPWSGEPRPAVEWECFRGYDGGRAYKELYAEQEKNQRGLCAFCEIGLTSTDHQIEHFHPKDPAASPDAECDWMFRLDNLLAACKGGSVGYLLEPHTLKPIKGNLSCGQFKESEVLDDHVLKPTELPMLPGLFRIDEESGRIKVDAKHCEQAQIPESKVQATIDKLHLDCRRLCNARRAVIEGLREEERKLGLQEADDDEALQLYESMVRRHLLPGGGATLQAFFTTRRSFFSALSETILQEQSPSWV